MKINRLIGIISVLLQEKMVTAPELAEKFEVSRRTINRDVEALSLAGIPIYTIQGTGGGIGISENYRMDKTLLTSKDMQSILAGLRSLDSISGSRYYGQLMEKLLPGSTDFISGRDYMLIDLSSWYKTSLTPKIEMIQTAIEDKHLLKFEYLSNKGESTRVLEPCYLIFKWSSWYLWGWNQERNDFRLFKLTRMDDLSITEQKFEPRKIDISKIGLQKITKNKVEIKALFAPEVKWRVVEEFGLGQIQQQTDGWLLLQGGYSDLPNLIRWLMTFGSQVKVIEPLAAKKALIDNAQKLLKLYQKD